MQPWPEGTRWLSAHIFFNGGIYSPDFDRLLYELVEPFVRRCQAEGWVDGWFFIRYSELGPHVRLRLHGASDVLDGVVWPALQEHVRAAWPQVEVEVPPAPEPEAWHPGAGTDAASEPVRVTHLALIDYEPETERYGGPRGVRLAERFFEHSSEAALGLLRRAGTERSSRLGKGLLSMVVLVHVFTRDRALATEWAGMYNEGYLRGVVRDEGGRGAWLEAFDSGFEQQSGRLVEYVEEVWSRMEEGEELSEALDRYRDGLLEVRADFAELLEAGELLRGDAPLESWDAAVRALCSSYLHMMNNRLGISIQEESYLAYLVRRALQRPADSLAG